MARASRRPMAAGSAASLAAVRAGAWVRPLVGAFVGAWVGAFVGALAFATIAPAHAEEIGSVNTHFRVTGSDRVVIEAYDDPEVDGITCYVSRARTGGIKGSLGMAEDPAEASIACRQVGKIAFKGPLRQQDNVFSERMSILFKTLHVVRVVDRKRNTLVYLTYSDRIVSGSPKNSVTAVPVEAGTPIPLR